VLEGQVDERGNDTGREDPFGDVEGYDGLDLAGPAIEGEEVDGGEDIDGVDGDGDDEGEQEVSVCEGGEAGGGLEVIETLRGSVSGSRGGGRWPAADLQ
jgi:hypothetical protein